MRDEEHHVQDALELYAVAFLQKLAETYGVAISVDAAVKHREFVSYAFARGFSEEDFVSGRWQAYKRAYDTHLPVFFDRLRHLFPSDRFDFINVEVENRNAQRKGDFLIKFAAGATMSVSLKNYRGGALRPQLNSGTYNSFILNFLFDSPGVGTFTNPVTGKTFRSAPVGPRDAVLISNGYQDLLPHIHALDRLNMEIKSRFVTSPEFEYLDEVAFDAARKQVGEVGAGAALTILNMIDRDRLKRRLLRMTGMDGSEEMLLMDPVQFADTITNDRFRALRTGVRAPDTGLTIGRRGQGIGMDFVRGEVVLLQVDVPFTINKNGAWISGDRYTGTRYHSKERRDLAWGQRRPRKSRELATSINTYVNFAMTGIFPVRSAPEPRV